MQRFEYKVVPAPKRGLKAKGAKTTADRFAVALTALMNEAGQDGWEYLRADTLPCEERVGLTGKTTQFQNMLVFRRPLAPGAMAPVIVPEVTADAVAAPEVLAAEPAAPFSAPLRAPLVLGGEGAAPPVGPAPGAGTRGGLAAE